MQRSVAFSWPCLVCAVLAVVVTGCRLDPPPVNRSRAMAMADSLVEHRGLEWGPISEVWEPTPPDDDGRRWWQIDFGHAGGVDRPVVLVDAASGWARFPRPDEPIRQRLAPLRPAETARSQQPPEGDDDEWPGRLAGGEWIALLIIDDPDGERLSSLAVDLNRRARARNIRPLFSVRIDAAGRNDLIFGWDGQAGIRRDEAVRRVLARLDAPAIVAWEQLGAE